jgi:hypothetical protein
MTNIQSQTSNRRWRKRWHQGVVLVILLNLVLVGFNLTYISLRGIYLKYLPTFVRIYDPVKGISPHPVTQHYLETVHQLRQEIAQEGLSSEASQETIQDLNEQGTSLIEENPFIESGQASVAAKLNRRMRGYVGTVSTQQAFQTFWTTEYLDQVGWDTANQFLRNEIEPLLQRGYYRETLPTGQFIDYFGLIDVWFIVFFGVEFLGRTFVLSRRRSEVSWDKAIARRWYELPLVLPFWQWMRILPLFVRLHRTDVFKVDKLIGQITHEPMAYLSERASQYLLVQLIGQTQESVQQGTLFAESSSDGKVIIGDRNKIDLIADQLIKITVMRVVPTIRPEIEEVLRHSMERALTTSDLYESVKGIPGLDTMPESALNSISNYLAEATCTVLEESYADQEGRLLLDQLSQNFRQALKQELQDQAASQQIQVMLINLLEEIKINYIQGTQQRDPEVTMNQVESISGE